MRKACKFLWSSLFLFIVSMSFVVPAHVFGQITTAAVTDCAAGITTDTNCYEKWVAEFTGTFSTIDTDFNQDGIVSLIDFEFWRRANPQTAQPTTTQPTGTQPTGMRPTTTQPTSAQPTSVQPTRPGPTTPAGGIVGASKGYLTNNSELKERKSLADSGQEPYKSAVADLLSFANSHMGSPSPQSSISIPGTDGPFVTDSGIVYAMGLAYGLTGDAKYAQKGREYIMAWVNTAKGSTNTCPDSGSCQTSLIIGRNAPAFVFGADLIKPSGVLSSADDTAFKNWLKIIVLPTASIRTNNWGDAGTFTRVALTDYIGDTAGWNSAIAKLKSQIDLTAADGSIPEETRRGSSGITYSEEALDYRLGAVKIAERRGLNLWDYGKLKLSTDYLAKYMANPGSWPWASGAGANIHGVWEIAYQHWKNPAYQKIITGKRPYGVFHNAIEWTTVTNGIPF
jgi:hypothetical protein